MRRLAIAALIMLGGCGGGASKDAIADQVEDNADDRAAAMREASESMTNAIQRNGAEQQADMVKDAGDERADAIRNSQLDASTLDDQQKNELIEGK